VATWRDAVQDAPGGARLLVEVTAGARQSAFPDGFNPWRGRIGVRVAAPAQEGRANAELVRTIAAFFRHPAAHVHVEAGLADARKAVRLMDLGAAAAQGRLQPLLDAGAP